MGKTIFLLVLLAAAPSAAQDYTIVALSHQDNKVSEIDPVSGRTLREFFIPGEWSGEPHEGAVSPDSMTMYVSVPYSKQVLIFDLETFKPKGKIETEYFSRPSEVRNFAFIGRRESTSGDPHGVALNRDGSKLYVTVEFAEVPGVVVYDVNAGRVTKKIDTVIAGNYLSVHPDNDKLYFPARNDRVIVIDTKTDHILRIIPTHAGSRPNGVAFGGANGEVWVNGDGDGSVTVIDPDSDKVIKVIHPRVKGAGRVAVSPDGRLAAATQGKDVSPDSSTLHVMNELSNDMVTFDMRSMTPIGGRIPVGTISFGGGIRVLRR
jgi:YVTN family beta-propeller protein